jgi:hypothetical protein
MINHCFESQKEAGGLALNPEGGILVTTSRRNMVAGNFGTDEEFIGTVAKPRNANGRKDFDLVYDQYQYTFQRPNEKW